MDKGVLNEHQSVMTRHEYQQSERYVYFQAGEDGDEHRSGYYLDREKYDDMGQPDQVTVSIKPGDHLTPEDSASKVLEINNRTYDQDGSES